MNCPKCGKTPDEHEAGRCMDAWVADTVLHLPPRQHTIRYEEGSTPDGADGWEGFQCSYCGAGEDSAAAPCVLHYSIWIADAWQVVEHFRRGFGGKVAACIMCLTSDEPFEDSYCRIFGIDTNDVQGQAGQMPLAICRTALKAVGGDSGD